MGTLLLFITCLDSYIIHLQTFWENLYCEKTEVHILIAEEVLRFSGIF